MRQGAILAVIAAAGIALFWQAVPLAALMVAAVALFLGLRRRRPAADWIVVDGSNVMYWQGDMPQIKVVADVTDRLRARGLAPVVWFDANAGYLLSGAYMGPADLARPLGLPEAQVFVAPRGTPADPLLLAGAATLGARVVSNDRFRDWADQHPEVGRPGFLVRGRVIGGLVALDLAEPRTARPRPATVKR